MDVNVILCSNDIAFKNSISRELNHEPGLLVNVGAFSIMQLAGFISHTALNVIIIDVTQQRVTDLFLRNLIDKSKAKVIIIKDISSAFFPKSGITDYIYKPADSSPLSMKRTARDILLRINAYAQQSAIFAPKQHAVETVNFAASLRNDYIGAVDANHTIVVIASSTGGTEALPVVFRSLPDNAPPVLVVQHMPAVFTTQFADRLNGLSRMMVGEAKDGAYLRRGHAFIAPGDFHMRVVKRNGKLCVECFKGEKLHGVRPAADILFNSAAAVTGRNTVAVILTGMGADGARGMFELHAKGAKTIAQNKETCVVYGMPKVAYDMGAVDYQLPISDIASKIIELA